MHKDNEIAVAILNWNGKQLLERFLPSVVKYSPEATVYIIDNASTDASKSYVEENWPSIKWIQNSGNGGYAKGYNDGLVHINEAFAVLLNSDVEVSEAWLQPLLKAMQTNPKLAALQPKIKDLKNKELFEYAGAAGGFIDHLGYPFCRGRIFYELEKDEGQYDTYREVFWATGACLVVRNDAFKEAGGLNELLFAHMEEIDLCWRLKNKGFEIGCAPDSVVYHLGGGTLDKLNTRKTFLNFRNNLVILFLNLPPLEAFTTIFMRLVLDGAAALKFLLDRQPKHFIAVFKAHFAFYGLFPKLVRQKPRSGLKPLKKLSGVYKEGLVEAFFLKKQKTFTSLNQKRFN
jgi:GT2 family glycosyltransferase